MITNTIQNILWKCGFNTPDEVKQYTMKYRSTKPQHWSDMVSKPHIKEQVPEDNKEEQD